MFVLSFLCLMLLRDLPQGTQHPNSQPPTIQKKQAQKEASNAKANAAQEPSNAGSSGRAEIEHKNGACSKEQNPYDPRQDALYRWYLRATIIGVAVGLAGIGFLLWQSVLLRRSTEATARSAKATERSVKLQENTQRQWIDLREWKSYRLNVADPLEIEFGIANPTNLPLTLHGVETVVDGQRIDEEVPIMLITPGDPLPHSFGVPLSPEQESLYQRNALGLEIDCTIFFADSHNIHWVQELRCNLMCGRTLQNPIYTLRGNKLYESGIPGQRGARHTELPS